MSIDLTGLAQASPLSDFPVLVRLDSGFPYDLCSPDGLDLGFRAGDGQTPLAYELEAWNPGGESVFWVKVPVLAASPAPTTIWLYFSAQYPLDGSNAAAVWSNGYAGVWHGIVDTIGGQTSYRDSAGGQHGLKNGAAPAIVPGPGLGPALDFSVPSASLLFPDSVALRNLGPLTLEFWISDPDTATTGILLSKGDFVLRKENGRVPRLTVPYSSVSLDASGPSLWPQDAWTCIAIGWGGDPSSDVVFYEGGVNRSQVAGNGLGTRLSDAGEGLHFSGSPPDAIQASFDELRISRVARSTEWIQAQFLSQQGGHLAFGAPEDVFYE